jgi:hypothetical protein
MSFATWLASDYPMPEVDKRIWRFLLAGDGKAPDIAVIALPDLGQEHLAISQDDFLLCLKIKKASLSVQNGK